MFKASLKTHRAHKSYFSTAQKGFDWAWSRQLKPISIVPFEWISIEPGLIDRNGTKWRKSDSNSWFWACFSCENSNQSFGRAFLILNFLTCWKPRSWHKSAGGLTRSPLVLRQSIGLVLEAHRLTCSDGERALWAHISWRSLGCTRRRPAKETD